MTVSSSTNRVSYAGNGSTTVFPYTYKIFDQDDLTVILRAANGTETVQTITSQYTVSGVGNAGGGNVTMLTAPASGTTLVILREQDLIQELDIVPNDPFPADSLEGALDKLTFMVQQHEETLDRTIKASRTNTISSTEFTISAADRANKIFGFDAAGDLSITQELGTYRGDWAASTAYNQRDIVKDGGNDNLYFCNTSHTSSGSLPISSNTDAAKWDLLLDVSAFTTLYDQFDDRYLGAKSSDPATDNDGNTLIDGALYWNTTDNRLKVYDLGNTAWKFTAPSPAEQANIDILGPIAADVSAVAAIDSDVTAVAADATDIGTVASNIADVNTVAGISADVTAVAGDATDIGTVAADIADVSTVAGISGNVTTVAGISANVTTVAGISADVTTVATNVADVTNFADVYVGPSATDPTTRTDSSALQAGDLYFNTATNQMFVYDGSAWAAASFSNVNPTFTSVATTSLTVNGNNYPSAGPLSNRNKIINGAMTIDQRNAGALMTSVGNGVYTVDRWVLWHDIGTFNAQQNLNSVTPPTGFANYLGFAVTGAATPSGSNYCSVQHKIEGFNFSDLGFGAAGAQSVTLSFWVRSSLTGTFGGGVQNNAQDRSYPFAYTINAADTWEQKVVSISGDTTGTWLKTNGSGLVLCFDLGTGPSVAGTANSWAATNYQSATGATSIVATSGATFYITGVQLEAGDTATPFENRSYGAELALCQRYYQKSYNTDVAVGTNILTGVSQWRNIVGNGGVFLRSTEFLRTQMRATPTYVIYTQAGVAGSFNSFDGTSRTHTVSNLDKTSARGFGGITVTGTSVPDNAEYFYHYTASAEL